MISIIKRNNCRILFIIKYYREIPQYM